MTHENIYFDTRSFVWMHSNGTTRHYSKDSDAKKEGKLTKVSMYHENGQLAQEGYLKNNRLHGKWIKYSTDGKLVCVANYTKGERNGTWLFWDNNDLTEVEFKDNKIVQKISWEASTKLVDAQK